MKVLAPRRPVHFDAATENLCSQTSGASIRNRVHPILIAALVLLGPSITALFPQSEVLLPQLLLLYALATVGLLGLLSRLRRPPRLDIVGLGLLAFIATQVIAFLLAGDPRSSLMGIEGNRQGLLTQLSYVAVFAFGHSAVMTLGNGRRLVLLIVVGAVPVAAYGLIQAMHLDWIGWEGGIKPGGLFSSMGGPNEFAGYLLLIVPCALFLALSSDSLARLGASVFVGILLFLLLMTGSRAGVLVLVAVSLGAVAVKSILSLRNYTFVGKHGSTSDPRWRLGKSAYSAALAICLAVIVISTWTSPVRQLYERPVPPGRSLDTSSTARIELWAAAIQAAAFRPLFGYGQDSAPLSIDQAGKQVPSIQNRYRDWYVASFHNILLDTLVSTGLLGLTALVVIFTGLAAIFVERLRRLDKRSRSMVAWAPISLLGFLIHSLFNPVHVLNEAIFWLLAGVAYASTYGAREEAAPHPRPVVLTQAIEVAQKAWGRALPADREGRSMLSVLVVASLSASFLLLSYGAAASSWPKPLGLPGPLPQPPPYPLSPLVVPFASTHALPQLISQLLYISIQGIVFLTGGIAVARACQAPRFVCDDDRSLH